MEIRTAYSSLVKAVLVMASALVFTTVTGCSSKMNVQFKINSEPEGSHVVMNINGPELANSNEWIYLGHTPIRGVRQISEENVENVKVTLKVMHTGYYDQVREWDGESFWNEAVERGVIFWTPELIPQPSN